MNELNLYYVDDLIDMFGVTRKSIYNYLRDGVLVGHKAANKWIFTKEQVQDVIDKKGFDVDWEEFTQPEDIV